MANNFYITTAIPYVNGKPHIGHAYEYFLADTIRRYHQLSGKDVLLLSGSDENALKNVQAAEKEGTPIKDFLDRNSEVFKDTYEELGVHLDVFQRGSNQDKHWPGVQKLWSLCDQNGDIYEKVYEGLYCVGCESFKTEKELVDGLCPEHQKKPELVKEKNYFFKLSKYQDQLLKLIESNELKITPENKRSEILSFIKSGLEDFSISRSKQRAKGVGVPVPNDPDQIIYVWFDALAIYITGIGYGWDEGKFNTWWPANVHIIGKDINRFHTVYWPAVLLSAGIDLPKAVFVHSFINVEGLKMSKSIGNVIDPRDITKEFGLEPVRYFLLSQIPTDGDGDFNNQRFKEVYNANLANGLGNLTSRVAKLAENSGFEFAQKNTSQRSESITEQIEKYCIDKALELLWKQISEADKYLDDTKPWKQEGEELRNSLTNLVERIRQITVDLEPFMPESAGKIADQFKGPQIKTAQPLFPRLS